jgi:hypothetical protein
MIRTELHSPLLPLSGVEFDPESLAEFFEGLACWLFRFVLVFVHFCGGRSEPCFGFLCERFPPWYGLNSWPPFSFDCAYPEPLAELVESLVWRGFLFVVLVVFAQFEVVCVPS